MLWLWLWICAVVHGLFTLAELYPWSFPKALALASAPVEKTAPFAPAQKDLVAAVVHNAGVYNAIVAGGFAWAAVLWSGHHVEPAVELARVLFSGVAVAGVFGWATLKSKLAAGQAFLGIAGLFFI
jgi:uncharacterized membrane protein